MLINSRLRRQTRHQARGIHTHKHTGNSCGDHRNSRISPLHRYNNWIANFALGIWYVAALFLPQLPGSENHTERLGLKQVWVE